MVVLQNFERTIDCDNAVISLSPGGNNTIFAQNV